MPGTEPQHLFDGKFSLFQNPDGGFHLSYRVDGEDEDKHINFPGAMMAAAKAMSKAGKLPFMPGMKNAEKKR
jgi:hypothetical protein